MKGFINSIKLLTNNSLGCNDLNRRFIYGMFDGWFTASFNKVDEDRIKEVGIDRAAAEWLLRCGGKVRCVNSKRFISDYNSIATAGNFRVNRICEIDATDTCVKEEGFLHLKDLDLLTHVTLCNNKQVTDDSMGFFCSYTKSRLKWLKLWRNGNITDKGLLYLTSLNKLEYLDLQYLPGVENPRHVLGEIAKALPSCHIQYPPFTENNSN